MARLARSGGLLSRVSIACCLAAASTPASHAGSDGPLIVDARILWTEDDGRLALEVLDVHGGFVAGSIQLARPPGAEDGCGGGSHGALQAARAEGWTLELVLAPAPGGDWTIECARRTEEDGAQGMNATSDRLVATPPLALAAGGGDVPSTGDRRRIASAISTPTFEQEVARLVNVLRRDNGNLPPLKQQSQLDSAAETHSQNMATRNFLAHCDLDTGDSPWVRIADAGYSAYSNLAENIAAGSASPSAVVNQWAGSSGHLANMLSTTLRELGVGHALDPTDSNDVRRDFDSNCFADSFGHGPWFHYWTQTFGSRYYAFPLVIEREAHSTTSQSVQLYLYGSFPGGPTWAQEMRFSNDGSTWSSWQPYNPNKTWTLAAGNGTRTVWAQVRNGGETYTSSDTIELDGDCPVTTIQNQVLSGTQSFVNCEIHAGPTLEIAGSIGFYASRTVLRSGFSVAAGAELTVGAMP
jgi:uncharacterized protein YkwD